MYVGERWPLREAVSSIHGRGDVGSAISEPPLSGVHLKGSTAFRDQSTVPEGIPRDYTELYKLYAPFVTTTLRRYNKVGRNFEEMYAYVWKRLVEKDVIRLYMDSVSVQLPPKMTTAQVIDWFGIAEDQWVKRMQAHHIGTPIKSKRGGGIIGRRKGPWAPTPINADTFQVEENERVARAAARGEDARPQLAPRFTSPEAEFDTEDIMILATMEKQLPDGTVEGPFRDMNPREMIPVQATKAHFQAYLSKSIWSDFSNWCRTFRRKFAQDKPMYIRPDNEEDADWERNLVDPSGAKQETQTIIRQACTVLSRTLHRGMQELGSNSKCKPVEQTEMQMFELLEQGVPLPEVVKKLEIPDHVRRMVLRSIADIRTNAA